MSIAVSAVLRPSRLLRLALAALALSSAGAGAAVLLAPGRFYLPVIVGAACLLAAVLTVLVAMRLPNAHVLDISGVGDVRLSVQQSRTTAAPQALWYLQSGSTLWPWLMVLRLRPVSGDEAEPGGTDSVLVILPDCVAPQQFRQLAVAARAIARRDNKFFENNKIF